MSQPRKRAGRVTPPKPKPSAPKPKAPAPKPAEPATPKPPAGKLGLLKVLVQPVLVLTAPDGGVQEVQHPVIEVKGVDWAEWAASAFNADELETIRKGVTAQPTNNS